MTLTQLIAPLLVLASCTSSGPQDVDTPDYTLDDDVVKCASTGGLTLGRSPDVLAGDAHQFRVLDFQGAGYFDERPGCATSWSVDSGVTSGITIDQNGLLTASSTATPGSAVTVTATLATGDALQVEAFVYTRATHPQVGHWEETGRISCADGSESAPDMDQAINELHISTSGHTEVTWFPFETYVDYWVDVTFASPNMTMGTPSGNQIPSDLDGTGTFELDGEDLVLRDMYLGTNGAPAAAFCGHRFSHY